MQEERQRLAEEKQRLEKTEQQLVQEGLEPSHPRWQALLKGKDVLLEQWKAYNLAMQQQGAFGGGSSCWLVICSWPLPDKVFSPFKRESQPMASCS